MTIAVQENVSVVNSVRAVCAQQRRLLKRLETVSHYLGGIVAGLWLPGIDSTFDNPVRKASARRPVFVTLEVLDDGTLNFTGSISRLRDDKFVFTPIFAYDVSMAYTHRGGGRVLPANNLVLARRANELLGALVSYGRDVSFGTQAELRPAVFPDVICDARGTIFEDYTPVLGFAVENPAADIKTVLINCPHPAGKILTRHGLETIENCPLEQASQIAAEFVAELLPAEIDPQAVVQALRNPTQLISVAVPFDVALHHHQQAVVDAMRAALPSKYKMEAGYNDLLRAAKNPADKLYISRFSALQIFPVETVEDLPESYAGTVLASVTWAPAQSVMRPAVET